MMSQEGRQTEIKGLMTKQQYLERNAVSKYGYALHLMQLSFVVAGEVQA